MRWSVYATAVSGCLFSRRIIRYKGKENIRYPPTQTTNTHPVSMGKNLYTFFFKFFFHIVIRIGLQGQARQPEATVLFRDFLLLSFLVWFGFFFFIFKGISAPHYNNFLILIVILIYPFFFLSQSSQCLYCARGIEFEFRYFLKAFADLWCSL